MMIPRAIRLAPVIALLLYLFLPVSCVRRDASGEDGRETAGNGIADNGSAAADSGGETDTAYTLSSERSEESAETGERTEEPRENPEPGRPWRALIPLRNGEAVLPADFEVGPLADPYAPQRDRREIVSLVSEFLQSYSRGNVREDLIAEERRTLVVRSLRYPLEEKALPRDFRIGVPETGGADASVRVRLSGSSGSTEGTIYLVRDGERWTIDDLQIDFLSILETAESRSEPFRPEEFAQDIPY